MRRREKVLVTGITGFLGSHLAIQLLQKGYHVTGTVRDRDRIMHIRRVIGKHTAQTESLRVAVADLDEPEAWGDIVKGMDYIMHVASPFPRILPKDDKELIKSAREGTLNVLKAASEHKVKRVVLTSSSGTILYGKEPSQRSGVFSEKDWTDPENLKDTTPYYRSKTLAEQAAWDFMEQDQSGLELSVICPGLILGPVLEEDFGTSANVVIKTMDGSSPALPRIGYDIVDVRSVADLHIRAMKMTQAAGERFAASAGYMSFREVAETIRNVYPYKKIPRRVLPNFMLRLYSSMDKTIKPILIDVGAERRMDSSKARQLLGWEPISARDSVLACAHSVVKLGIVA